MNRKTRRELATELDELKRTLGTTDGPTDVTVEWRVPDEPAPADDTIHYDPETQTLTYDCWQAQRDCLDALENGAHDIVGFLGGYASGKTVTGARWVIAIALANPGSRFLVMGQSFEEAREATFLKLFAQLPGDDTQTDPERSPIVADYTQSKRRLTLTNGSVIVLGSADSWSRYAGAEFGGIWLDEPSHYDTDLHDLLEMLGSRFRGVAGPKVQCWTLTGNGFDDAWEILAQRQDSTGEPLGHSIELIRASAPANPYLPPDDLAGLKRRYAGTDREAQALYGEFAAAKGLVYDEFSRETHVLSHAEAVAHVDDTDDWRIYAYDAGWNDPRVILELGKTAYDQLVVLDVFYESESHVEDAIAWLETADKPSGLIYCEHAPADIDRFTRNGYRTERATKTLDAGIDEVRKRLGADGNLAVTERPSTRTETIRRSGRDTDGRRRIKRPRTPRSGRDTAETATEDEGRVGLLVSAQCRPLIREFQSYTEDDVGTPTADDDCLDALRYACMGVAGR